jgi:hypothetical protein
MAQWDVAWVLDSAWSGCVADRPRVQATTARGFRPRQGPAKVGATVLFTAGYDDVHAARADLHALEKLHEDGVAGRYDAAVIDEVQGKPRIASRLDRPGYRVIPEVVGSGTRFRKELHDAARELTGSRAGLVVIADPPLGEAVSTAIRRASRRAHRSFDVTADDLARELFDELGVSAARGERHDDA